MHNGSQKMQLWCQQFLLIFLRTNLIFYTKTSLISYGGSNSSQGGALWGVFLLGQSPPLTYGSRRLYYHTHTSGIRRCPLSRSDHACDWLLYLVPAGCCSMSHASPLGPPIKIKSVLCSTHIFAFTDLGHKV